LAAKTRNLLAIAVCLLAQCSREANVRVESPPDIERSAWLQRRLSPCQMISESMRHEAGPAALSCSDGRTNQTALACANDAFQHKQPFMLCDSGWGMDSHYENGVVGLANGNVLIYYLDTFGPRTRGTCLRPNVSLSAIDWPRCATSLMNEIDLKTGQPYLERPRMAYEEDWPQSCAQAALRAPRWPIGVELVSGQNPIPDPARWGLRCKDAITGFEMLIDQTGKPQCVRVISVGLHPPAPGLYDSIRMRLMQWRFKPPTLHGRPLAVRWGMQINTVRAYEPKLPGPQIYPVCP
jgi:hypothetical protein